MIEQQLDTEDTFRFRAYQRAGESSFVGGNVVTLLQDGPAVYKAWLDEIAKAKRSILLENYIIHHDRIGIKMVEALVKKAKEGVFVCVLYDWLGCLGTSLSLWRALTQAGALVRAFNPFQFSNPLISSQRNHSKLLCVDGHIGFVGGLCIGDAWAGDPARRIPPWRDTALKVEGPVALALCKSFDTIWSLSGPSLPKDLFSDIPFNQSQNSSVQIVRGIPGKTRMYREFQALLSTATSKVWITDAYFILPNPLYKALIGAASDGVDVRVLVPRHSDIASVSWASRSGYAGLLDAGIRIFEWEGPMLHAKTAVVDGRWSRVGSSNMNYASFFTNYELDLVTDDKKVASRMEESFLHDIGHASELVLSSTPRLLKKIQGSEAIKRKENTRTQYKSHSQQRKQKARAAVARVGAAVLGIALRRPFQQSAWTTSTVVAILLTSLGLLTLWKPLFVGLLISAILLWFGVGFILESIAEVIKRRRKDKQKMHEDNDISETSL